MSQRKGDSGNPSQGHLAPARVNALSRKASSISDTGSAPDSLLDLYGTNKNGMSNPDLVDRKFGSKEPYDEEDPEHSRWIHRDKLARIESQELQAAGIVLPRARASSKSSKSSRRDHSRDQSNGFRSEQAQKRKRIEEEPSPDQEIEEAEAWDLRLPEEAEEDPGYMDASGGVKGVSRIPVLKTSPLPIPMEHLERDTILPRKQGGSITPEDDRISIPKSRGRSQSIKVLEDATATPTPATKAPPTSSPQKKTPAVKKGARAASAPQKPKPKPGHSRDTNSGQRPTTRSGDLGPSNSVKRPEGDPPWLASMYKPDPRLPPDQQLLPTVAKRLQQEQWEKEGKFGNAYDTSFRPLNDEAISSPIAPSTPITPNTANIVPQTARLVVERPEERLSAEWPLKAPKSPALSTGRPGTATRVESYSTMPKVTGTPQGVGPLPSPKPPIRMELPPKDSKKKGGCGCCVVM